MTSNSNKEYGELLSFDYEDSIIPLKDQVLLFAKRVKEDEQLKRLLSTEQREKLKQQVKSCYLFLNQSIDSSKHSRETILAKCENLERNVNEMLTTVIMVKEVENPNRAKIDSLKLKKISSSRITSSSSSSSSGGGDEGKQIRKRRSGRSFFQTLLFPKSNENNNDEDVNIDSPVIYVENQIEPKEFENLTVEGKLRKYISGLQTNLFKKQGYIGKCNFSTICGLIKTF